MEYPIKQEIIDQTLNEFQIKNLAKATIREIVAVANTLEKKSGLEFIKMEMGSPGLPAAKIGVEAEIKALQNGVASIYPPIEGVASLKEESSRFIKAFVDLDLDAQGCVPTVGSMQGTYAAFLLAGQCNPKKDTILFVDPGFPVQKQQVSVMGYKSESFDIYNFRGEKLREKLESILSKGNISSIVYSNPNNPAWFCLRDEELRIIGELATKHDVIVMEDLAYFAMDFRTDLGVPFQAPYQPSVGKYTDKYILFISGSKAFSYAGQRIGVVAISNALYNKEYDGLKEKYGTGTFGRVYIQRILYALSSGTAHSPQYAMAAMFKAATDGEFNFLEDVREYGRRAARLKEIFLRYGFKIVYDKDLDQDVADGFYFTLTYPGMTSDQLIDALISYGISAISLATTGSEQQGLRACTSFIKDHQYEVLEERLKKFEQQYK